MTRRVRAFAHRGGAFGGPENSLAAFRHAHDLGYRHLETDVHLTSDGVLVAFHDDTLDRVTDGTGTLAELTWAEVSQARIGGREPIPTFEELLLAFPDAVFSVDIKAPGAVRPLAELLERLRAWDQVVVASFSGRSLRAFRRLAAGRCRTEGSTWEVALHRFGPRWLTRLLTAPSLAALSVPHRHRLLGLRLTIAVPGLVTKAHSAGIEVWVWTIDDPEEMDVLLDLGVDGLMSDETEVLKDVLTRRDLWTEQPWDR